MSKDKNTITQFKFYFDLDNEVKYINEMNKKGWKLVYIKGGCFYTFVKTQPDEYFTTLYCTKKEDVSRITTFAAQCGYESIPHTMDGLGDILYLTGKKSEVSEEFSNDTADLIECFTRLKKKFLIIAWVFLALDVFMLLECVSFVFAAIASPEDIVFLIGMIVFLAVFLAAYAFPTGVAFKVYNKYKKRIKNLKTELTIYE